MSKQNNIKPKNVRDSYKFYKSISRLPVDCKTYIAICNDFNKFLAEKVLDGEEVTLPARMGSLSILGRKQKIRFDEEGNVQGLAPDWVKTKQLWENNSEAKANKKVVYHTNEHSSQIRYKFLWSKMNVLVTNKTLYALLMTRTNKRAVHEKIMNGTEYLTK